MGASSQGIYVTVQALSASEPPHRPRVNPAQRASSAAPASAIAASAGWRESVCSAACVDVADYAAHIRFCIISEMKI